MGVSAVEQSKQAQEYLIGDWISPFMEAAESNTSRRKLEVMSTVTEHSADIGAELSDTITVSGFPADHGSMPATKSMSSRQIAVCDGERMVVRRSRQPLQR